MSHLTDVEIHTFYYMTHNFNFFASQDPQPLGRALLNLFVERGGGGRVGREWAREREPERERDLGQDRERERQRERDRQTERERDCQRLRDRDGETDRDRA